MSERTSRTRLGLALLGALSVLGGCKNARHTELTHCSVCGAIKKEIVDEGTLGTTRKVLEEHQVKEPTSLGLPAPCAEHTWVPSIRSGSDGTASPEDVFAFDLEQERHLCLKPNAEFYAQWVKQLQRLGAPRAGTVARYVLDPKQHVTCRSLDMLSSDKDPEEQWKDFEWFQKNYQCSFQTELVQCSLPQGDARSVVVYVTPTQRKYTGIDWGQRK